MHSDEQNDRVGPALEKKNYTPDTPKPQSNHRPETGSGQPNAPLPPRPED